jgi:hypothetical protein
MVSILLVGSIRICQKIIQIPKLTDKDWEVDWPDIYKMAMTFGGIIDTGIFTVASMVALDSL